MCFPLGRVGKNADGLHNFSVSVTASLNRGKLEWFQVCKAVRGGCIIFPSLNNGCCSQTARGKVSGWVDRQPVRGGAEILEVEVLVVMK